MSLLKSFYGLIRYRFKLYYAEIKSRLKRGSFTYVVKDNIKFVCSKNDSFSKVLFISNGHEKIEMEWCRKWIKSSKSDSFIIDCGANIGFFSVYLAQANPTSNLIAIEGNENTFKQLLTNIEKLELKNIQPVQAILADSIQQSYHIPDVPGREPWQQAKTLSTSRVQTLTLDSIVSANKVVPSLIKIDCEGFEVKILKGAEKVLSASSTAFMVECNDGALKEAGTSRGELFNLFKCNNFKLFHLASFDLQLPLGKEIDNNFPSKEFNFVAIPNKEEYINRWKQTIEFHEHQMIER